MKTTTEGERVNWFKVELFRVTKNLPSSFSLITQ